MPHFLVFSFPACLYGLTSNLVLQVNPACNAAFDSQRDRIGDAGLDELLLVGATDPQNAMPSQAVLDSLQPQAASVSTQPAATTDVLAPSINKSPSAELHVQPGAALRPAPFIPDFVLNPSLEAVEEEYSSSDYDEEDV